MPVNVAFPLSCILFFNPVYLFLRSLSGASSALARLLRKSGHVHPNQPRSLTAMKINPIRELKESRALGWGGASLSLTSKHSTLTPSLAQLCSNGFKCTSTETNIQISCGGGRVKCYSTHTPAWVCWARESGLCAATQKTHCMQRAVMWARAEAPVHCAELAACRRGGGAVRMEAQLSW